MTKRKTLSPEFIWCLLFLFLQIIHQNHTWVTQLQQTWIFPENQLLYLLCLTKMCWCQGTHILYHKKFSFASWYQVIEDIETEACSVKRNPFTSNMFPPSIPRLLHHVDDTTDLRKFHAIFITIIFYLNLKNIFQTILIVSRGECESYHILVALENWLNLSPNSR